MPTPFRIHLLPADIRREEFRGSVAIIVDVLRASTTICRALESGAERLVLCGTTREARARRAAMPADSTLMGGERRGVRVRGFDLGNSPAEYTPARVAGKSVIFTTTNGTAAALRASLASRVLFGCCTNASSAGRVLDGNLRPVHIVCAGTGGRVGFDDVAGAALIARALVRHGHVADTDDITAIALAATGTAISGKASLVRTLRRSVGGRGLLALGFAGDITLAAAIDSCPVVGEFNARTSAVVAVRG